MRIVFDLLCAPVLLAGVALLWLGAQWIRTIDGVEAWYHRRDTRHGS